MASSILKTCNHDMAASALERLAMFIETAPERLPALFYTWQVRITDRRRLRRLDECMLVDIGLNRADIEREAGKPFWRA